jgi:hypothetical protein
MPKQCASFISMTDQPISFINQRHPTAGTKRPHG